MGRNVTSGFETQTLSPTYGIEGPGFTTTNGAIETSVVRSGLASFKAASSTSAQYASWSPGPGGGGGGAVDRSYFFRCYVRVDGATPTATATVMDCLAAARQGRINFTTGGVFRLQDRTTNYGTFTPTVNQWHCVELVHNIASTGDGHGTLEMWVDGLQISATMTANLASTAPVAFRCGNTATAATGLNIYIDDVALNDDQGSNQNGRPGSEKIVLLRSISDYARGTDWTAGNGGTSSLSDALRNIPPTGVAVGSATDTSQIKDSANSSTIPASEYEVTLAAYTAAVASGGGGLQTGDTVTVATPVAIWGNSTSTVRGLLVTGTSNPSTAGQSGSNPAVAAGTFPTGWQMVGQTDANTAYAPSVTLGTSPRVKVKKDTTTPDTATVCFLGLYVGYVHVPGAGDVSSYLELKALDHTMGHASYTMPTTYVALFTASTGLEANSIGTAAEVSAAGSSGYVRQPLVVGSASAGVSQNSAEIVFPTAGTNWGTITHAAVMDSATAGAGNVLFWRALAAPAPIEMGQHFHFATRELSFVAA